MVRASGSEAKGGHTETWMGGFATLERSRREIVTISRGVRWAAIRDGGLGVQSPLRSILSVAAALFCCALAVSRPAVAQDTGWVLQGEGGLVTALVLDPVNPAILYATTARGIFKTTDGGASWHPQGGALEGKSILALAIDPRHNATVFATTDTGGIYRSLDGGEHWSEANTGMAARYVGSIAVDAASTAWAGTEAGRIFKSSDGGDSWTETAPPTAHISVMAIAPDPVRPGTVYVGTNSEGVYKTVDGGSTWTHLTKGLKRATVWNILVDKSSPSTVYAGTHEGFYRSTNGGEYWTPGNRGLTSFNILALAVDPASPSTLYAGTAAGVFATSDAGSSWRSLYPDLYSTAIALDPSTPSTLYAGTHLGVMKTQDRGTRWSPLRLAGPPPELAAEPPLPPIPIGRPRPRDNGLPQLPVVARRPGGDHPTAKSAEAAAKEPPAPSRPTTVTESDFQTDPAAEPAPAAPDGSNRTDHSAAPPAARPKRTPGAPRRDPMRFAIGPPHAIGDPGAIGHPEIPYEHLLTRGEQIPMVGLR